MVLAVNLGAQLLFLFVVLPLVLAAVIARLVGRRSSPFPREHLTSVLLEEGDEVEGELLDWRSPAQSFLDRHPMVTFRVSIDGNPPFEMAITQSVHRDVLRRLQRGSTVDVRLSADRTTGAIVFSDR
jgi:hypothetical protein